MLGIKTCNDCQRYILTTKGGYCLKENEPVKFYHKPCKWFYQNEAKD